MTRAEEEHAGEAAAAAAAVVCECRAALAAAGSTVIREVMGEDPAGIADWRRYPAGEVYDPVSHVQYFYHRHPAAGPARGAEPVEHGHFHLFLRGEGVPAGISPLLLPELAVADAPLPPRQSAPLQRGKRAEVCHLVALALDPRGEPVRLFTTNRWVTAETWYRAQDVIRMLDGCRLPGTQPSRLLNRWLEAVVRLFRPEIALLLRERDEAIVKWRWRRGSNALEDPRLEVTSSRAVDLAGRLARAERGADALPMPVAAAGAAAPRLPRLAEGWGG